MIRRGVLFSLPLLAVIVGLSAYGWMMTPADVRLPVHWGVDGLPNRLGGKSEAFLVAPVLAVVLSGVFMVLPVLDPRGENLRRSGPAVLAGWLGVLGLLVVVQAMFTLTAVGVISAEYGPSPHGRIILASISALVLAIGNVLPKARSNWFVGVRTPWTLSSEYAWEKSQRLAGRLFVASGIVGLIAAVALPARTAGPVLFGAITVTAIVSVMMSYVWWRRDPARRASGG